MNFFFYEKKDGKLLFFSPQNRSELQVQVVNVHSGESL